MEAECLNILLVCKEQCATENCQSEFYIIHSMHYSYNQSHLQTNTHNRITNCIQLLKLLHSSLALKHVQVLKLVCSLHSYYVPLLVNVNIRLNANESASFWEDIPQVCIKPTGVHTKINDYCVQIKI